MVFSRDIIILIVCTLLYATGTMRVFRPSWFGKANTAVQILSVPLALIYQINFADWARSGQALEHLCHGRFNHDFRRSLCAAAGLRSAFVGQKAEDAGPEVGA